MSGGESLFDGLININVNDNDAPSRIADIVQNVRQQFSQLSDMPGANVGQNISQGVDRAVTSVDELLAVLAHLREGLTLMDHQFDVLGGDAGDKGRRELAKLEQGLDSLIAKTRELKAAQGGEAPVAYRNGASAVAEAERNAQQNVAAEARIRDAERKRQGVEDEAAAKARADRERQLQGLTPTQRGFVDSSTGQGTSIKDALGALGLEAPVDPGDGKKPKFTADISSVEQQIAASGTGSYDDVLKAQAGLVAAENRLAESVVREAASQESADAGYASALKAREQAQKTLNAALEKHAAAELGSATQAQRDEQAQRDRQNAIVDPRQRRLQGSSDEFLAGSNIAEESGSLQAQALQIDRQALLRSQAVLIAKAKEAETVGEVSKLVEQREALERRILANSAAIQGQQLKDVQAREGKGGFLGGLTGNMDGSRATGLGDVTYQAGQAAKYFVFYQALTAGQAIIQGALTTTEAYTAAVNDLSIALRTSKDEAGDAAVEYAKIGQQYATGPVESTQAATKFVRTFRDDQGNPSREAGDIGARLGSLINVLEGKERIAPVQQDLIALTNAYGTGAKGAANLYDTATSVAQFYGYKTGGEVLGGTAQIADIGKESGYSPAQLTALVASVMQATGVTDDAAAGDIKRFLGAQNSSGMQGLFSQFNISPDLTFADKMTKLSEQLKNLDPQQKSEILTSAGGSRTGAAVAAAITGIPTAAKAEELANGAAGTAAAQAAQKLQSLSGEMKQLGSDVQGAFTALANSGFAEVLTAIVGGTADGVRGLTALLNVINLLPGPVKEVVSSLLLLTLAAKATSAVRSSFASSPLLQGLIGGGAGGAAAAGGSAAALSGRQLAAVQVQRQVALAAGNTALAASLTTQAAATGEAAVASTGLSARLGVMATSAGAAAAALGPLLAIVAGFIAFGKAKEAYDNGKAGAADAVAGGQALGHAGTNDGALGGEDPEAIRAALAQLRAGRKGVNASDDGFGGSILTGLGDAVTGGGTTRERKATIAAIDGKIKEAEARLKELEKNQAEATGTSEGSAFFGSRYNQLDLGIGLIESKGIGAKDATSQLNNLTQFAPSLKALLQPAEGTKGAPDLVQYILKQIDRSGDPIAQQGLLKNLQTAVGGLQASAIGGDSGQKDAVAQLMEQVNRAYLDTVVKNTQSKVEAIKAQNANSKKSQAAIRATITAALTETTAAGDVTSTIALIQGVDQAFLNTFRHNLDVMRAGIRDQIAKIRAMAASARAAVADAAAARAELAETGGTTGDTRTKGADAAKASQAAIDEAAQRAQLAALDKSLATLDKAIPLSAPSGSSFKYPKDGAGPTAQDIELARIASTEIPGDPLSAATTSLQTAQYQLKHAKNQQEYYQALKALRQAQYELGQTELQMASERDLAGIDITDPVAMAKQKVTEAQRQLTYDKGRGALGDVIQKDQNALRQARSDASGSAWSQEFQDQQTNYDLQRTSLSTYLNYLRTQHDYLSAVKNKTRQQVDQLNEVDRALKGLTDGLQGQFNLGDIKVPSPYEVRRALAGGANGYAGTQAVSYVTITVNGNDTAAMKQVLADHVGQPVLQTTGSAPRKV